MNRPTLPEADVMEQERSATLLDEEIRTRPLSPSSAPSYGGAVRVAADTGDDSGDTSDTSDTGDDTGDTGDTGDDAAA